MVFQAFREGLLTEVFIDTDRSLRTGHLDGQRRGQQVFKTEKNVMWAKM